MTDNNAETGDIYTRAISALKEMPATAEGRATVAAVMDEIRGSDDTRQQRFKLDVAMAGHMVDSSDQNAQLVWKYLYRLSAAVDQFVEYGTVGEVPLAAMTAYVEEWQNFTAREEQRRRDYLSRSISARMG